jgi:hypothetical protein
VQGSEDSLPQLVTALLTKLLGANAGVSGTTSNEAMRAYLAGMAEYRRANSREAEKHFSEALHIDSSFVLPAYRLVLLRTLFGTSGPLDSVVVRNLWNGRARLSGEQRLLVESVSDINALAYGNGVRSRMELLPRIERAVTLLPNSAEAWDILGDLYFHVGGMAGREDWIDRARRAFTRAVELDATLCPCAHEHLADFAFFDRDARLFAKHTRQTPWQRYQAGIIGGVPADIRAARLEYMRDQPPNPAWPFWLTGISLPNAELDSLLVGLGPAANTDRQRTSLSRWLADASTKEGRPSRANEARAQLFGADTVAAYQDMLDYAEGDSLAAERVAPLIGSKYPAGGEVACDVALSRLRRGDTTGVAAILSTVQPWPKERPLSELWNVPRPQRASRQCWFVLTGVFDAVTGKSVANLMIADSVMRFSPLNCCHKWNYDLGVAFARRGNYAAAAAAARRRWLASGGMNPARLVIALRQEGKWAAVAGDTTAAIKAYRHYLLWREKPEQPYVAQRDSVRAELASLERRKR